LNDGANYDPTGVIDSGDSLVFDATSVVNATATANLTIHAIRSTADYSGNISFSGRELIHDGSVYFDHTGFLTMGTLDQFTGDSDTLHFGTGLSSLSCTSLVIKNSGLLNVLDADEFANINQLYIDKKKSLTNTSATQLYITNGVNPPLVIEDSATFNRTEAVYLNVTGDIAFYDIGLDCDLNVTGYSILALHISASNINITMPFINTEGSVAMGDHNDCDGSIVTQTDSVVCAENFVFTAHYLTGTNTLTYDMGGQAIRCQYFYSGKSGAGGEMYIDGHGARVYCSAYFDLSYYNETGVAEVILPSVWAAHGIKFGTNITTIADTLSTITVPGLSWDPGTILAVGEDVYNLTMGGSGYISAITSDINIVGNLTIAEGTNTTGGYDFTVEDSIKVTTATSVLIDTSSTITIGGDFVVSSGSATLTHNATSEYIFTKDGADITSAGKSLPKITANDNFSVNDGCTIAQLIYGTDGKTGTFEQGETFVISALDTSDWNGAEGFLNKFRSSLPGTQYTINIPGDTVLSYVNPRDYLSLDSLTAYNSVDSTNNTKWGFGASGVTSKTHYVSTDGSGTWEEATEVGTPCLLDTANVRADTGDTVLLLEGIYTSAYLNPSNSGESGNIIIFRNNIGDSVVIKNQNYGVYFDSVSYVNVIGIRIDSCLHLIVVEGHSSYNNFDSCTFNQGNNAAEWEGGEFQYGAQYNTIKNCTFSRFGYRDFGSLLDIGRNVEAEDSTYYNLIENNTFYYGGHHCLAVFGKYNVIRGNVFHNEKGSGVDSVHGYRCVLTEGIHTQRNVFDNNIISYADSSHGFALRTPHNIVRRNSFYKNGYGGIQAVTLFAANYTSCDSNVIYSNTFLSNGYHSPDVDFTGGIYFADYGRADPTGNIVKNNIFFNNSGGNVTYDGVTDSQIVSNNWLNSVNPYLVDTTSADPFSTLLPNLNLLAKSRCIDSGYFLTTITSATSTGTKIKVSDAGYFFDGFNITTGDTIQVEGQDTLRIITAVDYATDTITVSAPMTWDSGDGISLLYSGSKPDLGAFESDSAWFDFCTLTVATTTGGTVSPSGAQSDTCGDTLGIKSTASAGYTANFFTFSGNIGYDSIGLDSVRVWKTDSTNGTVTAQFTDIIIVKEDTAINVMTTAFGVSCYHSYGTKDIILQIGLDSTEVTNYDTLSISTVDTFIIKNRLPDSTYFVRLLTDTDTTGFWPVTMDSKVIIDSLTPQYGKVNTILTYYVSNLPDSINSSNMRVNSVNDSLQQWSGGQVKGKHPSWIPKGWYAPLITQVEYGDTIYLDTCNTRFRLLIPAIISAGN
jgi:hypothetical protein